jgi:hypothetical protein
MSVQIRVLVPGDDRGQFSSEVLAKLRTEAGFC